VLGASVLLAVASGVGWLGCTTSSDGGAASPTLDDDARAPGPASTTSTSKPDASHPAEGPKPDAAGAPDAEDAGDPLRNALCFNYCNTVQTNCAVDYTQFESMHACLTACQYYPLGTADDPLNAGNTLKCRQTHASGGIDHCLHGGAFGYGGCGSMCEGFCQIAMSYCAASPGGAPFATSAECMSECQVWAWAPADANGGASFRATSPTSGDTLDCREVMLVKSLRSIADRDTYCPLTKTNSATCR
jgi:hypothetical protein